MFRLQFITSFITLLMIVEKPKISIAAQNFPLNFFFISFVLLIFITGIFIPFVYYNIFYKNPKDKKKGGQRILSTFYFYAPQMYLP